MLQATIRLPKMVKAVRAAQDIPQRTVRRPGRYHNTRGKRAPAGRALVTRLRRRLTSDLDDERRDVSRVGVAERVGREPGRVPIDVADPREGDELPDPALGWDVGPSVFGQVGLEVAPEDGRVSVGRGFFGKGWGSYVRAEFGLDGVRGVDVRGVVVRGWHRPGVGRWECCWIGRVGGAPGDDDSGLSDA